jgi:uncharacterized membrane protein YhiD involved in acid resistance
MSTETAISLAMGIALGAVVGVTSDNIAMGIGVGTTMWIAAGFAIRSNGPK